MFFNKGDRVWNKNIKNIGELTQASFLLHGTLLPLMPWLRLPVAGGVHNGEYVSWLYCYDPIMDVWARKQDMNTKRAIHVLAGMNDRLYAIGGNHLKGECSSLSGTEQKIDAFCF